MTPGQLYGLPEWRSKYRNDDIVDGREVLMLPFAANQALLQGQSTDIVLKHGRFFDLFQDCIDHYESIVGMALMGDDNFLKTMPLCHIDDFDVRSGYRGKVTIRVTLRAVARARMIKLSQMQPVVMGWCEELVDLECPDLDRARELVDNIEATTSAAGRAQYDIALQNAREDCGIDHLSRYGLRTAVEMTAASWDALSLVIDRRHVLEAIASDNLIDRLQLGLNAILEEKLLLNEISTESNGWNSGFD